MDLYLNVRLPDRDDYIVFNGKSFGYYDNSVILASGEIVFQTGMVGYNESLTDPSYKHQVLVFTYPLIGSYGVPDMNVVDKYDIPKFFESDRVHTSAVVVDEYIDEYSHHSSVKSLSSWLIHNKIPGIYGIDTRELTLLIREHGTLRCVISTQSVDVSHHVEWPDLTNVVKHVSCKSTKIYDNSPNESDNSKSNVLVIDCGMKNNQLRCLLNRKRVKLYVVNSEYDFVTNPDSIPFNKIFISNGPGNPEDCTTLINNLKLLLSKFKKDFRPVESIFGVCLGHQIISLAAGFKTYKLKYGNRGHNIPCKLYNTDRCYVTSQNHGYAVDISSKEYSNEQTSRFIPLFTNINDGSNEGLCHTEYPIFSVQFHPEAKAGPEDTEWLFDVFLGDVTLPTPVLQRVYDNASVAKSVFGVNVDEKATDNNNITKPQKVLVLGSGGLSIGQSGEFDYSGSQAIKAYTEEGMTVVLVNPNIATVQTSSELVDKIYFLPVNPEFVEKIIQTERPDCIALSFGGQTALNCGSKLYLSGVLDKYNVKVLGTPVESILKTEDRDIFKKHIESIGEKIPNGVVCSTFEQAVADAKRIGFPVLVRAAFALGGLGSGFANNESELNDLLQLAFSNSDQVIIDKSLKGWKEIEYEVVRDCCGNCITVCNMENFDPLGVHTGESIVIAPSQTLSDEEYNMLRTVSVKVIQSLGIVGECNIQFALDPYSLQYYIIEVNARLSRSSALGKRSCFSIRVVY